MAEKNNDVLMRIVAENGTPITAECQTKLDPQVDDFVYGFTPGSFFEVEQFSFGMNIDDKDPNADPVNTASAPAPLAGGGLAAPPTARTAPAMTLAATNSDREKKQGPSGKFARWKSATPEQIKSMKPYPVLMDEISITRLYDRASPILFDKCCNSESLKSATLVKRRVVGANVQGLRGYLRMTFGDVLLTHIEWENGDVPKETLKFVFRSLKVEYGIVLVQAATVRMESVEVNWDYKMELQKQAAAQ
jgi:type VI protein secretion system component Hcp